MAYSVGHTVMSLAGDIDTALRSCRQNLKKRPENTQTEQKNQPSDDEEDEDMLEKDEIDNTVMLEKLENKLIELKKGRLSPLQILLENIEKETLVADSAPINQLPDDVLLKIFNKLELHEIYIHVREVCKKWLLLCRHPIIWNKIDLSDRLFRRYGIDLVHDCVRYAQGVKELSFYSCMTIPGMSVPSYSMLLAMKNMPELISLVTSEINTTYSLKMLLGGMSKLCVELEELDLVLSKDCQFDEECVPLLRNFKNLKRLKLSLRDCTLTASVVMAMRAYVPNLEEFHFDPGKKGIPNDIMEAFVESGVHLTHLHFTCQEPATLQGAQCVPRLVHLKHLFVYLCTESNFHSKKDFCQSIEEKILIMKLLTNGMTHLDCLSVCSNTKGFGHLYDAGMFSALKNLPNLKELHLVHMHKLTNKTLAFVRKHCKELEELTIVSCFGLTKSGVVRLVEDLQSTMKRVKLGNFNIKSTVLKSLKQCFPHIKFEGGSTNEVPTYFWKGFGHGNSYPEECDYEDDHFEEENFNLGLYHGVDFLSLLSDLHDGGVVDESTDAGDNHE